AAEVVDPCGVDELEGAPEAFDPPAIAALSQRPPVVEGVAPVLAGRAQGIGRRAGNRSLDEELGMGNVVGACRGDVDRDVADQSYAALRAVVTQRAPLALEPNLVCERALAGELRPVTRPVRVTCHE